MLGDGHAGGGDRARPRPERRLQHVVQLLELGVDPNATDTLNEQTAVMFAAATNAAGAIRLLANAGADLNARSTVIDPVGRNSEREGIDPNPSGTTGPWLGGLTALHFAAAAGSPQAIEALVRHGADPDAREPEWGQTPIMFAAAAGRAH